MSDYEDDVFESDIPDTKQSSSSTSSSSTTNNNKPQQQQQQQERSANHHYRVSFDIRSIRDLKQVANVFVSYVYPAFGSPGSVRTSPPVKVMKGTECLLPNPYCSFEFAMSPSELEQTMQQEPLILEVIHRDPYQKDNEIGIVKIVLSHLLSAPAHESNENDKPCRLQVVDAYYNVYDLTTNSEIRAVGTLRVVTMLEDFGWLAAEQQQGQLQQPQQQQQQQPSQRLASSTSSQQLQQQQPNNNNNNNSSNATRPSFVVDPVTQQPQQPQQQQQVDVESRLRREFAEWKRKEEENLEERWRRVEQQRMQVLEREWKKHVVQREATMARKQKELGKLEKRVKETLFDLEKQERRLKLRIEDHKANEKSLKQQHERDQKDTAMVVKRLKEHFKHQLHLKQKRCDELTRDSDKARAETQSTLERYEELLQEYRQFKIKTSKSQNGMLRLDLVAKENELIALKQQAEQHKNEQQQLQNALKLALKEVARMNKLRHQDANQRLEAERADLQRLRMQYLAKQQQEGARRDNMELQSIKSDLRSLIDATNKPKTQQQQQESFSASPQWPDDPQQQQQQQQQQHDSGTSRFFEEDHNVPVTSISAPLFSTQQQQQQFSTRRGSTVGATSHEEVVSAANDVERLKKERDDLMQSGIYTTDHPFIQQLTEAIVRKTTQTRESYSQ